MKNLDRKPKRAEFGIKKLILFRLSIPVKKKIFIPIVGINKDSFVFILSLLLGALTFFFFTATNTSKLFQFFVSINEKQKK